MNFRKSNFGIFEKWLGKDRMFRSLKIVTACSDRFDWNQNRRQQGLASGKWWTHRGVPRILQDIFFPTTRVEFSHDCIEMPLVNNELRNRIQLTEPRHEESKEEEAMKENLWITRSLDSSKYVI